MTDTPGADYLAYAAQAAYVLLYEDAPYKESTRPLDAFGPFADVIKMLREFHQNAIALTLKTGKVYDVYADARGAWEGMRSSDDGTKQYGLLDREITKIAYALVRDEWVPPVGAPAGLPDAAFRLYSITDLRSLPAPEWLIPREIPARSFVVLCGPSETGKTFMAIDYAMRIAAEHPDRAVVYIAAEGGSGYRLRVDAWLAHHQVEAPPNVHFLLGSVAFLNPVSVELFIQTITSLRPIFVGVDTLARNMVGGDENSARDMGMFVDACDRIKERTDATVMPLHHTIKSGSGYRGSSALFAAADQWIDAVNEDGLITVSCGKSKEAEHFPSYRLRLVQWEDSLVVMSAGKVTERDEPLQEHHWKMLAAIASPSLEGGVTARELMDASDLRDSKFHRTCDRLIAVGGIRVEGPPRSRNRHYHVTEKGRALLEGRNDVSFNSVNSLSLSVNDSHSSLSLSHSPLGSERVTERPIDTNGVPKDHEYSPASAAMIERRRKEQERKP